MKPYLIGLLILTVAIINSQGITNMIAQTEEYLNPGEPIKVKVGQTFGISMKSNPTTGYGWKLSKALDNKVVLVTNVFVPPDSKLVGAGGHEVWTFKAVGEGQTDIAMKYVRPWEQDQSAVRTGAFTVIVK